MQNQKPLSARILSLVLTAAMVFSMMPTTVFAAEGVTPLGASGIECHKEHDKDCGYVVAVEGADCSHKNEDGTYSCVSDTVSDNTATPCNADKSACTHEDDCGYVEAVEGADCKHTCEKCEVKDSGAADKQSAYDKVVDLFKTLPDATVINRETTEKEKDIIFAQLTEAMDAFDALTADEQDLFLKEQLKLYKAAMALNDAITGATPKLMADVELPPFVEGNNTRYKSGETFVMSALKIGDRIEVGAFCDDSGFAGGTELNFDSYELFLTNGLDYTVGPFAVIRVFTEAVKNQYKSANDQYNGGAGDVSTRTEWIVYSVATASAPFLVSPDRMVKTEYDVTVDKSGLTGATAQFDIILNSTNKPCVGNSFKVADFDKLLVTLTPESGKTFAIAPTVASTNTTTVGIPAKQADGSYTCEIATFTGNPTITVAGTAGSAGTSVDKTALSAAVIAATTNKGSVETSTDGTDVAPSKKWVTEAVKTAYNNAITAAQTVANKTGANQAEIDAAVTALATATTTFNNAKADGTKPAPVTKYAITFVNPTNGTLAATVDGSTITSGTEVELGKTVTFTVTPNSGYEVNAWSGATAGTPNTTATLTVSAAATVSVTLKVTPTDKTTLTSAITAATTNKGSVETSTDGTDVAHSKKWVTAAVNTAYETAIAAAQAVIDNTGATQAEVDAAVTALAAATTTFNNAKADGTKPVPVTKYAITFTNPANGTLTATVDGSAIATGTEVATGKTVTFTVTPNSGYEVNAWSGATAGTPNTTATLTVSAAATVSVTLKVTPTDKTTLTSAITAATTNKDSVETSTDGADVAPSKKWVTEAVKTAYNNAITAAQTVANKTGANQAEIDAAVTALATATTTFNNAKADGTKPVPVTKYAITFTNPANGTLTATVDGSAITTGTEVATGKIVTFTVTPNSGYEVNAWSGATAGTPNTTATLTVSAAATVSVTLKAISETDQQIADRVAALITSITAPNKDATTLTLPTVSDGCTIAIKSSSNEAVISLNGTITPPDAETEVTLVLTVTKGSATADTISIKVKVPAKSTATPDKTALNTAITEANNAKSGITTNNASDPSSVSNGIKYVSDTEMKALTDAIAAAQTVANNTNATTAEVNEAVTELKTAVDTFKAAVKTGTYSGGSSGGGSSGGGSSGDGGNTTTPPVVVPPTTTQPNPPTTVETKVPATVDNNGNATVNVTDKTVQDAIDKAVSEAKKNGTSGNGISVIISVTTGGKDANTVTVNLPKTVQEKVIAGKVVNTVVVVDRPDIAINMNLATITEINRQANADVQLSATRMDNSKLSADAKNAIGNRPTFDLKASYASGAKSINNFGNGSVTVEIPYTLQNGEAAGGLYAVYVDGNGKVNYITNSSYDAQNKVVRFTTNHFSIYGIGYKAPTGFTDITNHWAKTDIEFVVNRGLFSGTSATTFAPNSAMTRGMFVATLGRLANADVSSYKTSSFSDVKADAYYLGYIEWASKNNIVKGIGEGEFAPDQSITREQMAVIIESYAKAIGYTLPNVHAENTFADSDKIGAWAKDSVKKVQMAGIISGKASNMFDPQGTATRAEVSAVLHRFIELVISTDTAQGWMMNDSGKWMYYENGKAVTGSKKIGDETYTFDQYGEMVDKPKNLTYGTYTVKKGDSFWKIAFEQKCNMFELARVNGKTIFSIIHPNDTLQIPQQ